jgi:hypothetical protein
MAGSHTRATMDAGLVRVEAGHLVFANGKARLLLPLAERQPCCSRSRRCFDIENRTR